MGDRISRRSLGLFGLAVAGATVADAAPAAAADRNRCRPSTLFVAGDSTAAIWPASVAPKAGWGQALPPFLDPRHIVVDDRALSGASSKSFIEVGLLDAIVARIGPGDRLLISFGHNDEKTDERGTDPATTFPQYLSRYIDAAREHGAHPILVTPVERRRFNADGHAYASHGAFPQAMRDLGAARGVPVIDLTTLSMALWDSLGAQATKDYFLWFDPGENPNFPDGSADNTHFQAYGAIALARIVVDQLVQAHLIPRAQARRLHRPVPDNALVWPAEVFTP